MKKKPKLCPKWPNCECIVQGYVNPKESKPGWVNDECGKKPT